MPYISSSRPITVSRIAPHATPLAIATLNKAFDEDPSENKLNLAEGTVRDQTGNPYMFPSIKRAQENVRNRIGDKMYEVDDELRGKLEFCRVSAQLAFADAGIIPCATIPAPSGTSALQLLAVHLANCYKGNKEVYMPNATWFVHESIFRDAGLQTSGYRYFDPVSYHFDFANVCEDISL